VPNPFTLKNLYFTCVVGRLYHSMLLAESTSDIGWCMPLPLPLDGFPLVFHAPSLSFSRFVREIGDLRRLLAVPEPALTVIGSTRFSLSCTLPLLNDFFHQFLFTKPSTINHPFCRTIYGVHQRENPWPNGVRHEP